MSKKDQLLLKNRLKVARIVKIEDNLRILRGVAIKKFVIFIRTLLIILSCLLLIFSIFAWISGLRISNSELLPILASSVLNLFLLLIYWLLGIGYIKPFKIPEHRVIKILSKVGFGGNIVLLILSILIIIGFGIIP